MLKLRVAKSKWTRDEYITIIKILLDCKDITLFYFELNDILNAYLDS